MIVTLRLYMFGGFQSFNLSVLLFTGGSPSANHFRLEASHFTFLDILVNGIYDRSLGSLLVHRFQPQF